MRRWESGRGGLEPGREAAVWGRGLDVLICTLSLDYEARPSMGAHGAAAAGS
jgi:hypothetical protein